MGASSELFLKMSSEYYLSIPDNIKNEYLADKIYSESLNDYSELIRDKEYKSLVSAKKKLNKALDNRKDFLRSNKLNNK